MQVGAYSPYDCQNDICSTYLEYRFLQQPANSVRLRPSTHATARWTEETARSDDILPCQFPPFQWRRLLLGTTTKQRRACTIFSACAVHVSSVYVVISTVWLHAVFLIVSVCLNFREAFVQLYTYMSSLTITDLVMSVNIVTLAETIEKLTCGIRKLHELTSWWSYLWYWCWCPRARTFIICLE